jgi:very-short-patch-repair endonuclease
MTSAEGLLWKYLKDRGLCRVKFRRQFPLSGFVLDFYCPSKKLAVEIDGGIHNKLKEYDHARQSIIEAQGITVLRFRNNEVMEDIEKVLGKIKRTTTPSLRSGEGCPEYNEGQGEGEV